jgi:hypothetical protein
LLFDLPQGRRYAAGNCLSRVLSDQELERKIIGSLPTAGSDVETRAFLMNLRH